MKFDNYIDQLVWVCPTHIVAMRSKDSGGDICRSFNGLGVSAILFKSVEKDNVWPVWPNNEK